LARHIAERSSKVIRSTPPHRRLQSCPPRDVLANDVEHRAGQPSLQLLDATERMRHHHEVELLERDDCLSSLRGYAEEAGRGEARLVLISGEAGVGKTSVVEALQDQIQLGPLALGRL
jgi:hypothetical protein